MRARAALVGVVLVAASSSAFGDDEIVYKGGPLPPNTHVEWRHDDSTWRDAVFAALGTWLVNTWVAGIGDAVCNGSCKDHSYDLLYIPLAGPIIAAAMPAVYKLNPAWSVILGFDATVQCGAALVAVVAYLLPTKRVIVKNTSWHVVPTFGGVGISATF